LEAGLEEILLQDWKTVLPDVSILIILEAGLEVTGNCAGEMKDLVSILIILEAGLEVQGFFYDDPAIEVSILIILEAGLEVSQNWEKRYNQYVFQS